MLRPDARPGQKEKQPVSGSTPETAPRSTAGPKEGMRFARRYSKEGVHPYDELEWEMRDAVISGEGGKVAFEQRNVEVPKNWSQLATNVVVSNPGECSAPIISKTTELSTWIVSPPSRAISTESAAIDLTLEAR